MNKKEERKRNGKERNQNFLTNVYNMQLCIVLSLSCQLHSQ
jgi:hypothetical protein